MVSFFIKHVNVQGVCLVRTARISTIPSATVVKPWLTNRVKKYAAMPQPGTRSSRQPILIIKEMTEMAKV